MWSIWCTVKGILQDLYDKKHPQTKISNFDMSIIHTGIIYAPLKMQQEAAKRGLIFSK